MHSPLRSKEGWFEWCIDPSDRTDDHQWYIDGSAINPRWRSLTTTGFGIVVVNGYGELIGYGRGAPPEWVRTAAASEAWALLVALNMSPLLTRVATDCKGLVNTASRGKSRATSAKHPLARIWNSIASCLDDDLHQLPQKGLIRWVPAHLTEAAIGTTLPCGRKFSATDWRANRLADLLAKDVAKAYGIPEKVQKFVMAAEEA